MESPNTTEMSTWVPISYDELLLMLSKSEGQMTPQAKRLWGLIRLEQPQKWQLHPWGDAGGGFWVVAVTGQNCLYYNDIEDGFNSSSFTQWGQIDQYFCSQIALHDLLNQFCASAN